MSKHKHTMRECLAAIGVASTDLAGCYNIQDEFSKIKKLYFKKVLVCHPDKGGNPDDFRTVQTSFEVLRDLFDKGRVDTFAPSAGSGAESTPSSSAESYAGVYDDFASMPTPSWEYYYSAAEEAVPTYRVELAKSGRSACKQKGKAKRCAMDPPIIDKGEIRIGSMEQESGSYGRWVHLTCWRVPSKVWLGFPDCDPDPSVCTCRDPAKFEAALLGMNEVLLCGFSELSKKDRAKIVAYAMDKNNWARLVKRKDPSSGSGSGSGMSSDGRRVKEEGSTGGGEIVTSQASRAIVSQDYHASNKFIVPVPGRNGALANALAGKTVVCTGVFPELGGGAGLNLGKDRLKALVASFGGRVTGSVSGKTDILIVGKAPGFSKVSQARAKSVQLMDLRDLALGLTSAAGLDLMEVKPMKIKTFSSGYRGNGIALDASSEQLAIAQGLKSVEPIHKSGPKAGAGPKGKKRPSKATQDEDDYEEITCDNCGADCTDRSWFVVATGSDFCGECRPEEGAVPQTHGADIIAIKGAKSNSSMAIVALPHKERQPQKRQKRK